MLRGKGIRKGAAMGIYFYERTLVQRDKASLYYGTKPAGSTHREPGESEEPEMTMIKFSELMREPVSRQLNTILNKENSEFMGLILGSEAPEDKKVLDVKV